MGRPSTLTPATYAALLHAYRNGGKSVSHENVSKAVGCSRDIANRVYQGHYASAFAWAPAIRDVLSGAIPEPVMPRIWPPPQVAPMPPRPLAVVRPITEKPKPPPVTAEPIPTASIAAPPPQDPATVTLPEDAGQAQAQLLADLRNAVYARFTSSAEAAPDFDAFNRWLAGAMRSYAELMSSGRVELGPDALEQAGRLALMAATIREKDAQAVERLIGLEKKWNPPPKDKPAANKSAPTPDEAKRKFAQQAARWGRLAADPNPPELLSK